MLKKLRELFQAPPLKEQETITLDSASLPGWLARERERSREELAAASADFRSRILAAVQAARSALDVIRDPPVAGGVHPKLGKVLKNSVPEFIRAMEAVLSRDIPEDPEEAYSAMVEMLKGGLRALSGPGKYLRNAFPYEIRAMRAAFDGIGQEVTRMNPPLSAYRDQQGRIDSVEKALRSWGEAEAAISSATRYLSEISRQEELLAERDLARGKDMETLLSSQEYATYHGACLSMEGMDEELQQKERAVRARVASVVHALERAGKLARKAGDETIERGVHALQTLMSAPALPDPGELRTVLSPLLARAGMMAAEGALPLRNREEREFIGDPAAFWRELDVAVTSYSAVAEVRSRRAEENRNHPVAVQISALDRAGEEIRFERSRLQERRLAEEERLRRAEGALAAAEETLRAGVDSLSGGQAVFPPG